MTLLTCLGCGGQGDGLLPVEGRFLWEDGSELSSIAGAVHFDPLDKAIAAGDYPASGQRGFMSELTGDGYFELETFQLVDGKQIVRAGVPPGEYKVRVFLLPGSGQEPMIHPDYEHPLHSPLTVVVEPKEFYELTLDRKFEGRKSRRKTRSR